jgi:RecB family exonuclease
MDANWLHGVEVLSARLSRSATGAYEGELCELAGLLAARYSASYAWSASKLETYGTCPYYFFIADVLGLEPRTPPEEGYDVRMLGSMLHKILEDTFSRVDHPTDLNECLACMEATACQVFATAPGDYGFRPTALWAQQQQELVRTLRRTITALAEASQGFTPRHFEQKFGMGNPSLVLQTEIGEIRLHGYIDRVDVSTDGRLRVIDYKSSAAAIAAKHLTEGSRLQLPIYALAARDALGLGEIADGFYWHIQRAGASSLKLETYDGGLAAAFEAAIQHVTHHVANIRAGHFESHPPPDGCPSYCPATAFCWRYKSKGV